MNMKKIIGMSLTGCMLLSFSAFSAPSIKNGPNKPAVTTPSAIKSSHPMIPVANMKSVVGKAFSITLDQNVSTGYSWEYKANSSAIKLVSQKTIDKNPKGLVGASNKGVWTFKASAKGNYEIVFTYARHWDKTSKAAKTIVYDIAVSEAKTSAQIPNPLIEYKTIDEARKAVGFTFAVPSAIPDGYKQGTIIVISKNLAEIFYDNNGSKILYRTSKLKGDISGDYNVYDAKKSVTVGNLSVSCRGTKDGIRIATWEDGDTSYSLSFDKPADEKELTSIIGSIK